MLLPLAGWLACAVSVSPSDEGICRGAGGGGYHHHHHDEMMVMVMIMKILIMRPWLCTPERFVWDSSLRYSTSSP